MLDGDGGVEASLTTQASKYTQKSNAHREIKKLSWQYLWRR